MTNLMTEVDSIAEETRSVLRNIQRSLASAEPPRRSHEEWFAQVRETDPDLADVGRRLGSILCICNTLPWVQRCVVCRTYGEAAWTYFAELGYPYNVGPSKAPPPSGYSLMDDKPGPYARLRAAEMKVAHLQYTLKALPPAPSVLKVLPLHLSEARKPWTGRRRKRWLRSDFRRTHQCH